MERFGTAELDKTKFGLKAKDPDISGSSNTSTLLATRRKVLPTHRHKKPLAAPCDDRYLFMSFGVF